ncbi:MAG: tRNA pseudouridine(55) synthase TruB [Chloroflexota bacterium]
MTSSELFGFLVVDKPQGMTSHDVVAIVRRGTHIKRIGHAGTLDPMATGVLVLCLGAATRLSEYVMDSTKTYTTTVRLGIETDTYDAEGQTLATHDTSHLTRSDIEAALTHFQGDLAQIPPMYSAIKQGGKKLYELARAGQEVERAPRKVSLDTTLLDLALPDLTIKVVCTAGAYIRSIAHDLGAMLGVGAHLTALRRNASGALNDPVAWQTLIDAMSAGAWHPYLIDEHQALAKLPAMQLDAPQSDDIRHGRPVVRGAEAIDTQALVRAYDAAGQFIAILSAHDGYWKPDKVFSSDK